MFQAALEMEKNPGSGIPADWHPGDKINLDTFIPEPRRNVNTNQTNGSQASKRTNQSVYDIKTTINTN